MNHAGEITPLTTLVRPHVAIITTVEPVHLQFFGSVDRDRRGQGRDLRRARAGRHRGPQPRQRRTSICWQRRAREHGARVVSFGRHEKADVRPEVWALGCRRLRHRRARRRQAHRLPPRRAGGAHRAELACRRRRARRPRRRRREGGAGARRRCAPPRAAASAANSALDGGADAAHRRELQRQSRLDALGARRHGDRAARSAFRAASRCSATCSSWATMPGRCTRRSTNQLTRPRSIWSLPVARTCSGCLRRCRRRGAGHGRQRRRISLEAACRSRAVRATS